MVALGVAVALLYYGRLFFITLVISATIAFLLEPFVGLLVKLRLPRPVASFLVCSVGLLLIYFAGLGAYTQAEILVEDLPNYSERISVLVNSVTGRLEGFEQRMYELVVPEQLRDTALAEPAPENEPPTLRRRSAELPAALDPNVPEVRIRTERTPVITHLLNAVGAFYEVALMASFVPFVVYFTLSWKDHFRRSYLHLFEGQDRYVASRSWEGIAEMARAYVVGNFVLGVLLSVVSTLFFVLMRLPFALLVGPLSGFLSLVPYIGLPLSIVPPMFVALAVYDGLTPYLVIAAVIGFLHLLALNLLYPKVVGSRVHLNPVVVTIALMIFGLLWGAMGLVLAIPVAAGIKAVCDNVPSLQAYGRLLGD